ncbi:hypothetical protein V6N12_070217 [Hibiscus sabdariffa]|uniref:RNase H type-1 domain-containing protein n=1 Tax=Hibiscus sabdariffa TaxID=183260 RepID=A0ABR2FG52_9ROSI
MGVCSILEVELWGIVEGLWLAWDACIRVVLLEVDNDHVARMVQDTTQISDIHGLMPTIRELVDRAWVVRVRHIRRSINMVVDGMAKLARSSFVSSLRDVGFATRVFSCLLQRLFLWFMMMYHPFWVLFSLFCGL